MFTSHLPEAGHFKSKKQFKSLFFILNDIAMLYEVQVHG